VSLATKQKFTFTQRELRSAVFALLHEDPSLLRDAVAEFVEDEGLFRAMKEAEGAGEATADEVYHALRAAKGKSA
jgi:hypothetical protein